MNPSLDELRSGIELACQPTYVPHIVKGRSQVLALPRDWVLEHMEQAAVEALDLSDYWEYRRLLELAELLDSGLLRRFVSVGLGNPDPEVHEAAEDFKQRLSE
ncbi:MAG: hypothetical protein U0797_18690 [Gemmataceae bacterium]